MWASWMVEGEGYEETLVNEQIERVRTLDRETMVESRTFNSQITNKDHRIYFSFNCDSSNVVYLFDCAVCDFQ